MQKILTCIIVLSFSTLLLTACYKIGPNRYTIDPVKALRDIRADMSARAAREAAQKAQKEAQKEINALSMSLAEEVAKSGKKRIAVVDFMDLQGNITELGRFLAEEVSAALVQAGKGFEVIDRVHLKSILKEHKLSLTGLIAPATVKKLGRITGADAIVTGTTIPLGDSMRVIVKVLDTETARVISASAAAVGSTRAIKDLLARKIAAPAIGTGRPSTAPGGMVSTIQKKEFNYFTFELLECRRSGTSVTCNLLITNKGKDRKMHTYCRYSRMVDDRGNVYNAEWVQIGNKKSNFSSELLLVRDVPTRAYLGFENVSETATHAALLEFVVYRPKKGRVQFRNIPFTK